MPLPAVKAGGVRNPWESGNHGIRLAWMEADNERRQPDFPHSVKIPVDSAPHRP